MKRFNISLEDGVQMVFMALEKHGKRNFIPKLSSYRIMDVANAICEHCEKPIIGVRPGKNS